MEELDYNILYRWFVGLSLDDAVWDATTFTKNRDRLLDGDIADAFFAEVLAVIKADGLLSDEHFTVGGTLLEAWASHKSFKPKGGGGGRPPDDPKNPTVNFHGQTRGTTPISRRPMRTRGSTRKPSAEAKLGYLAHLLTENRHGLIVDTPVTAAGSTAERDAALVMLGELPLTTRRITVAADKAYDTRAWVAAVRRMRITPHVAQNEFGYGGSAIDARMTRHGRGICTQRTRLEAGMGASNYERCSFAATGTRGSSPNDIGHESRRESGRRRYWRYGRRHRSRTAVGGTSSTAVVGRAPGCFSCRGRRDVRIPLGRSSDDSTQRVGAGAGPSD